jgi:hypothetical protein
MAFLTDPAKLVPLDRFRRISSPKSSFVDKIWKFLLHEFFDFRDRFFQAFLGGTGDVQVEWRILISSQSSAATRSKREREHTAGVAMDLSG